MGAYIRKKLAIGLLLIVVISMLCFSLLYFMPGDPITLLAGERVSDERIAELKTKYGFDEPLVTQYIKWLKNVLRGDFGISLKTKLPVAETFAQRIPTTLNLCGTALVIKLLLAVPLGLISAYKKDSLFDRIIMAATSFFQALPNFWVAIALILIFSVALKWLPLSGYGTVKQMILPVASIVLCSMASTIRMMRSEVIDVMREKYVQTAYAKGLRRSEVMVRHIMRNALVLVVTLTSMSLPWIISGAVIMESIFAIPGMGSILTQSIMGQDFPIVQAGILIIATLTVVCNLLNDIISAMLDPRIREALSNNAK